MTPRIATGRGEPPPIDLDGIEMRWASQWNESDDGEVRAWRADVAALIDEVHRLHRVSNRYFEEMVRRTPLAGQDVDAFARLWCEEATGQRWSDASDTVRDLWKRRAERVVARLADREWER